MHPKERQSGSNHTQAGTAISCVGGGGAAVGAKRTTKPHGPREGFQP